MKTNNQSHGLSGVIGENDIKENMLHKATTVDGLPAEVVFQVGVSKIGHAYIYQNKEHPIPSDADLLFRYDASGNQILLEHLSY